MAAWGYEFYLVVLKVFFTSERSERVRDTFSPRRKDSYCIPSRPCNILYIFNHTYTQDRDGWTVKEAFFLKS